MGNNASRKEPDNKVQYKAPSKTGEANLLCIETDQISFP